MSNLHLNIAIIGNNDHHTDRYFSMLRAAKVNHQQLPYPADGAIPNYDKNINILTLVDVAKLKSEMLIALQLIEKGYSVIIGLINPSKQKINLNDYKRAFNQKLNGRVINLEEDALKDIFSVEDENKQTNANNIAKFVGRFLPEEIKKEVAAITDILQSDSKALNFIEHGEIANDIDKDDLKSLQDLQKEIEVKTDGEIDILLIGARYQVIDKMLPITFTDPKGNKLHKIIDTILLSKNFGIPIFFLIMYLIFWITLQLGALITNFSNDIFDMAITFSANILESGSLLSTIIIAILEATRLVMEFIPIIFIFFAAISFLEDCGYIARITYTLDNLLKKFGISGRIVPNLIIGFACNIPGIIAMKSVKDEKQRIISTMMMPFISCTARLSVFIFFCNYLVEEGAYNIIFILYITGIFFGLLTTFILTKLLNVAREECLSFAIEHFKIPSLQSVIDRGFTRSYDFLRGAGKRIFLVFLAIQLLCNIPWFNDMQNLQSIFGYFMPIFEPMGVKQENWIAVMGLLTGAIAKEALVATVSSLYLIADGFVYTNYFHGFHGVIAYLLFVLLYFPCISVFFTINSQLGFKWAFFSAIWSTSLAYFAAVLFFQTANLIANGEFILINTNFIIISIVLLTIFYINAKVVMRSAR